jgi:glycosyltransferase involved in cell wall biosynthesis/ubiquinone/menaquinone biosynthesis C-methylase UbiE
LCLYIDPTGSAVELMEPRIAACSERHKLALSIPPRGRKNEPAMPPNMTKAPNLIVGLDRGLPDRVQYRLAAEGLRRGQRVFFYWPREEVVEQVDDLRLASYWRHRAFGWFYSRVHACAEPLRGRIPRLRIRRFRRTNPPPTRFERNQPSAISRVIEQAAPVPLRFPDGMPTPESPLPGLGVYLRTDFWAPVCSGGSYGHTAYVAKELARCTRDFLCFLPYRFDLLDEFGVRQVIIAPANCAGDEEQIVAATDYYAHALRAALEALGPAYLYERLCLGNYAGALLSQKLGIPYLVEYNGSELSMRRSFAGQRHRYEQLYQEMERAAFAQATLISVVSEPIRQDLLERGVPSQKIVVNPNGADVNDYAPPSPAQKQALRGTFGWTPENVVIGFTGTFGGWHGIDVLAEALPRICDQLPAARFLIIGNGSHRRLLDAAVARHRLGDRVRCVGRVAQREGARYLAACDIFVSPHNRHMVDRNFFGSPTKLFEYMAIGGGVVASDLEQIGEVLSPALRVSDFPPGANPEVRSERGILCTPGSADEVVRAVIELARRPEVRAALGRNARQAVIDHYCWPRHIQRLWRAIAGGDAAAQPATASTAPRATAEARLIETGDGYKDQVQLQWNHNPCGSQYASAARPRTLEWFLEIERHRYQQYAPWMPRTMEFARHAGHDVLEIGGGLGTDLAQFARHGARVTDIDLSAGHLALAQENFRLRGLSGRFIHHDAEELPFADNSFDLVYSNGVIHHTPNTGRLIGEIHRVLKPGGRAIVMVYAENSYHYWVRLFYDLGLHQGQVLDYSMGGILSQSAELSDNGARPLVKVYTRRQLRRMFAQFDHVAICQRQMTPAEVPRLLRWVPADVLGRFIGWNLVVKARKRQVVS